MRIVFGIFAAGGLAAVIYLGLQLNDARKEWEYWKTREATLENEIKELRGEMKEIGDHLERLRHPEYQDMVVRRELGFGEPGERNYRFPEGNGSQAETSEP